MHFYVINLDRDADRLAFMQSQLDALGVAFERVPAVGASRISPSEMSDVTRPEAEWLGRKDRRIITLPTGRTMVASPILGRYVTDGEVACYLSHVRALSAFVESGAAWACILEDDVELDADLLAVLDSLAAKVGYGIVKLEGLAEYEIDIGRNIVDAGSRSVRFRFKPSAGSAAYFLTRATAMSLLDSLYPLREPYDSWFRQYWRHRIPVYELSPFAAKQSALFVSSIHDRSEQPEVEYSESIVALLGPIKLWYKTLRVVRRVMFLCGVRRVSGAEFSRLKIEKLVRVGQQERPAFRAQQQLQT